MNKPAPNLEVTPLFMPADPEVKTMLECNETKDTCVYWISERADSLVFQVSAQNFSDTVITSIPGPNKRAKKKLSPLKLRSNVKKNRLELNHSLQLRTLTPFLPQQLNPVVLYKDTLVQDTLAPTFDSKTSRQVRFKYDWKPDQRYKVHIPPGTFEDYYGHTNDTTRYAFKVPSKKSYGTIKLSIEDSTLEQHHFIVELREKSQKKKGGGRLVHRQVCSRDTTYTFKYLRPKEYTLRIIEDRNKNNKWDTGHYGEKRQPEPIYRYPKEIQLKPNWSIELKLSDLIPPYTKKSNN
jgi:uncharacterized protein (DUF2141 family)